MAFPAAAYISDNARTEGENKTAFEDWLKMDKQIPGAGIAEQALTLATDAVTPASGAAGVIIIDTEAAAAADNLATIVQTNIPDGSMLLVGLANASHVVTVKHLAGGTGQISLRPAVDLVMSLTTQWLMLKRTGTLWEEVWRSGAEVLISPILATATVVADPIVDLGIASRQYVNQKNFLSVMENGRLTITMAANAVTIALKGNDGNDPSVTNPVRVTFRSSTATNGAYLTRTITAALSMVISANSTGGTLTNIPARIYVGLLDNAGTVEFYWFNPVSGIKLYAPAESALITTVSEGGAGAADSAQVLYSTTVRTGVAHRIVGYFESVQAAAGVWATPALTIQQMGPGVPRTNDILQDPCISDGETATGTATIPADDTIPQNTEGTEFMAADPIVLHSPINLVEIEFMGQFDSSSSSSQVIAALFQDSVASALAAQIGGRAASGLGQVVLRHRRRGGTTSPITYKVRAGTVAAGTLRFNGVNGGGRLFGGIMSSILSVKEIMA